mmetsp:Transcript_23993/g.35868  ORF Transcript_23993/g.35868 Transcript_23993/m.35868 type:complete len:130 (+) Transcript_23993:3-392(+)
MFGRTHAQSGTCSLAHCKAKTSKATNSKSAVSLPHSCTELAAAPSATRCGETNMGDPNVADEELVHLVMSLLMKTAAFCEPKQRPCNSDASSNISLPPDQGHTSVSVPPINDRKTKASSAGLRSWFAFK